MSHRDFFGRPITGSNVDFQFDLCEVCQRKSPNWLEVQYQDNVAVLRFTCNDCHDEYQNNVTTGDIILKDFNPDEEIEESTRPGWVDDFIKDTSSTITTVDQSEYEIEETISETVNENFEYQSVSNVPLAVWAPKFIEQALFGSNPEQWLIEQRAFDSENREITLITLGNFASNEIGSVKLSAIQCLSGLFYRNKDMKDRILQELANFQTDTDITVSDFATQTIQHLK